MNVTNKQFWDKLDNGRKKIAAGYCRVCSFSVQLFGNSEPFYLDQKFSLKSIQQRQGLYMNFMLHEQSFSLNKHFIVTYNFKNRYSTDTPVFFCMKFS